MDVRPSDMTTDPRALQSRNAEDPMDLTLSGMVIDVMEGQSLNVQDPMDLTPSEIVTSRNTALLRYQGAFVYVDE